MVRILFDNRSLVAVDKPAGLASIPERDLARDSALSLLEKQLRRKLFIVHRLDKDASGILIFAKNPEAHKHLNDQFADRKIEKVYVAVVHGVVADDKGVVEAALRQYGSGRMGVDDVRGKPSTTGYSVVERYKSNTLIHAFPVTGRRHQIRVHCYHIGHPIVGDPLYGDREIQKNYPRLLLHALRISFVEPEGAPVTLESKLPPEFLDAKLRE